MTFFNLNIFFIKIYKLLLFLTMDKYSKEEEEEHYKEHLKDFSRPDYTSTMTYINLDGEIQKQIKYVKDNKNEKLIETITYDMEKLNTIGNDKRKRQNNIDDEEHNKNIK